MKNEMKERIYKCECSRCRAIVWLVEECGAVLQFSQARAGRLCELAVVAAEGANGIEANAIVSARRSFAKHIDVKLSGPTSDSDEPNHIKWAVTNSNHNPDAKNRINLGHARAFKVNVRYYIS